MEKATMGDQKVTTVVIPANRDTANGMATPKSTPIRPPEAESITVSIKN